MPILAITDDSLLFTVQGIFTQHRCVALLCFPFAIQRPHFRDPLQKEGGPLKYFRSATPIKHFNLSTLLNSWPLVRWRLPRRGKSDGAIVPAFQISPSLLLCHQNDFLFLLSPGISHVPFLQSAQCLPVLPG